jgi:hypothetical protein
VRVCWQAQWGPLPYRPTRESSLFDSLIRPDWNVENKLPKVRYRTDRMSNIGYCVTIDELVVLDDFRFMIRARYHQQPRATEDRS